MSKEMSRARKLIADKLRRDLGTLRAYWPMEFVSLTDLVEEGRTTILLANGEVHEIDLNQLTKLLDIIPEYLWDLIKVPFTFRYEKDEDGRSWYIVVGDRWQKRAVELILHGKLTSEGVDKLSVEEFKRFITSFSSLTFVSISATLT